MDFGTQLGALRACQREAVDLLRQMLNDPEVVAHLEDMAIERWEAGRDEYGDSTLQKTYEELTIEVEEELADAINYAAVWAMKQNGWRY